MPPMLFVLIFLAVFLAVEGLAMLLIEGRSGHRAAVRRRLRRIALGIQNPAVQSEDSILRARRRARRTQLDLAWWMPGGFQLERRLYQAGLSTPPGRFLLVCTATALGCWLIGAVLLDSPTLALPLVAGGLLPLLRIQRLRAKRMFRFEEQFPEALDLMTRAMRAGHSLTFAFQMVGEELADPIGSEFAQAADEIKMGQDLRVALNNLVYRMEAGDLPFFVTAITIQRETGGNLAEVLEKLGYLIRQRFVLYGKVRSLTAVGRASASLLASMPFLLVALLFTCGGEGGQNYVAPLYTTVPGHLLSVVAILLVVSGYAACLRMARIQV